ncbi:hypothetical protein FKP32DRAFT_1655515 [Trametes sanguinea]|nr:hypothetical protein FKP32DRAFT_1655515 [Trametes sanguinea]
MQSPNHGSDVRREGELEQAQKRIAELESQLAASQDDLTNTRVLLEMKSAELRDAQAFLNRVDDASDCEVLSLIERLNSNIFQTSANIAEAFRSLYGRSRDHTAKEQHIAILESCHLFSGEFVTALRNQDHQENCIVVQFALQALMVSFAEDICRSWIVEGGCGSSWIESIYARMRENESQTISGRWRALGLCYAGPSTESDDHHILRMLSSALADKLVIPFVACGIPRTRRGIRDRIRSRFGQNLCDVVEALMEVRKISRERIISRDLVPVRIDGGTPFAPERMDDEWNHSRTARSSATVPTVACTTHLGLVSEWISETSSGGGAGGNRYGETMLLKPKVVLNTTLDDLWRGQHQGRTRNRDKHHPHRSAHAIEQKPVAGEAVRRT